jgi:hypothetical protein
MLEYGMETSSFECQQKVQNTSNRRKGYAYSFLGLTRATTTTLSRERFNSEKDSQQWDAVWQAKACNSKQIKSGPLKS